LVNVLTAAAAAAAAAVAALQLDTAIQLLLQASSQQPLDFNVWFTLATALARKVYAADGTAACDVQESIIALNACSCTGAQGCLSVTSSKCAN
jgi:hypothetical protein